MGAFINLTGRRIEGTRWTVISRGQNTAAGKVRWNCLCDCGKEKLVSASSLRQGDSLSCGCLQKEIVTLHGMSNSPEYDAWIQMKQRCYNSNSFNFERWGGRGIVVCERWLNSFADFFADVGSRPSPEHSIDRYPNRDGDYEPGNVRWATTAEQLLNRDITRWYTHAGKTLSLKDWSREPGIDLSYSCLLRRLDIMGWDFEKSITTPKMEGRKLPPKHGTLMEYAKYKCRCEVCREFMSRYSKARAAADPNHKKKAAEKQRRHRARLKQRALEQQRETRELAQQTL